MYANTDTTAQTNREKLISTTLEKIGRHQKHYLPFSRHYLHYLHYTQDVIFFVNVQNGLFFITFKSV